MTMRSVIVVTLLVAASMAASVPASKPLWEGGYHTAVGIPLATRLRQQEMSRIIGGQPAPLGAYPHLVGLVITFPQGTSVCGSSLLSPTRTLTAAHCWSDGILQASYFTLVFGSEYIFFGGLRMITDDVTPHPYWNIDNTIANDIAVIAHEKVEYTDLIQPIALPIGDLLNEDFTDSTAFAAGYGMIGEGISLAPDQVQSHVQLQIISNAECRLTYGSFVLDSTLCTRGVGPVGVCSSDSGGPLSIVRNNQTVLAGVVSFGSARCEDGLPSAYARVTYYIPWIQQYM